MQTQVIDSKPKGLGQTVLIEFLSNLRDQARNNGNILFFGCGLSHLPLLTANRFSRMNVIGYDTNHEKIEAMNMAPLQNPRVNYTSNSPNSLFEIVIAHNVLHANPEQLTEEALSYLKHGGFIGILDYDMKGIGREDFFNRWGNSGEERKEQTVLGDDKTYEIHTRFDLQTCINISERRGIKTKIAKGKMTSVGLVPTHHFIYIGRKEE